MTAKIIPIPVSFPKKRISVIMVSYFTGSPLVEAIQSVLADSDILELVLVDNGNTIVARERLWEFAKQESRLKIIQGQGNIGFSRACNYGARLSKGDYLLFLNPDAVIDKGAAMTLADCGEKLTRPWITGGYLQTVNGIEQRGGRRNKLTPLSALVSFTPLHKIPGMRSMHLESEPCPRTAKKIPVVSGACLMMDRQGFDILGGFDERYFLHVEDIDICARARKCGGEVYFVPNAKVMHYGSTSNERIQKIEYEKFKGLWRYFRDYSSKWWARVFLLMATPFMFAAIMGRAWWMAVRIAWRGG